MSSSPNTRDERTGILYALIAYMMWGLFPLYWKLLNEVPATEILAHRMLWSAVWVGAFVVMSGRLAKLWPMFRSGKILFIFTLTAVLIALNWLTYIWAVNNNRVLESSLGYFINPLTNVLLGMIFLGERLRRWQTVAVLIAALSVGYLSLDYGTIPWVALALTGTMAVYGLLRKTAPLGSLDGLFVETMILFLPAAAAVFAFERNGAGSFVGGPLVQKLLLIAAGPITALPLLLFAASARRVPLSTIGLLQYLSPTIQFLLAVFLFHEPFSSAKLYAFIGIWLALGIYAWDGVRNSSIPS